VVTVERSYTGHYLKPLLTEKIGVVEVAKPKKGRKAKLVRETAE
jgi:hypothetical protein